MPPPSPPSGPRSMIQSAVLMTSRLCSMTSTVLPWSTSRARLGRAPLAVDREPAGLVAADLGLLRLAEQLADRVEHAGVGGGVRPRRAADRRLVDVDDLVEELVAVDSAMPPRHHLRPVDT